MEPIKLMLQQAVAAAKDGDRDTALELLREVLDEDEENVKAWLLLARLSDNEDERRIALSNVLALDPGNERAEKMLNKIEEKVTADPGDVEIIPGVTRRMAFMIGGGGLGIVFILLIILIMVSNNQRASREQRNQESTEAVQSLVAAEQQRTEQVASATAVMAAAFASETAVEEMTNPPTSSGPTLPPTPTQTPTVTPTPSPVPPPPDLPGMLIGWSGRGPEGEDLDLVVYPLNGGAITPIGSEEGRWPQLLVEQAQVLFAVYNPNTFADDLQTVGLDGVFGEIDLPMNDTLSGLSVSPDGTRAVFVTEPFTADNIVLFSMDLTAQDPSLTIEQLTFDTATYSEPSISPDGTQAVVVRNDTESDNPGTDLVLVNLSTGTASPLTTDRDAVVESMPGWVVDANGEVLLVYSAAPQGQDQRDIYLMNPTNPDSGFLRIQTPADDIYPIASPGGQYIAYSSDANGRYAVYLYDLVDSTTYLLYESNADNFISDWR